ncbi:alkaline phosphatase family protein [Effusibacillus lacus]|uniref:Sulfatase n=1 Tax=Effusibacillus lacus TaxID=1348429 RepID=A0A292YK29_9BACL|nr:alkaline phosphatase family protein [Effusibacillus lacus]TCS74275.1 type I phosphodiesterase/nucleotide pyrophosphatase [Effusibacillus lacus]GAX88734.1 sulfatase [Effusibacillus lacus]
MKSASLFEIVAARCWNVLNEGKTFTPVFVLSVFLIANGLAVDPLRFGIAAVAALPLFVVYYIYDYPLHLRWFLWVPPAGFIAMFGHWNTGLLLWAFGLYVFFTVFFWGTLYYHLRIGTTWWNFTRIWKLFLKNTDSTSGNVGEQLPKVFLLLLVMDWAYRDGVGPGTHSWEAYAVFVAGVAFYSWLVHKLLFNWKPQEYPDYTSNAAVSNPLAKRVVVIVIDGCRKERFEEADAPFLHYLQKTGVYYDLMETVYPARTVVCFSSMFTGTYPREHGIQSNMVWKLGVRVESVFDKLKQQGRKGVLFGCAHLIDAFGDYVESFTAVENNDIVDHKIMARAKEIMKRENPDLMVIQMIAVDQTGHSRGVLYPEYLDKIKESDRLIEDFYRWMEREGFLDDTVLVVMADHGQGNGIGGHGHLDVGERFVPFILHGSGIKRGVRVKEHRSIVSLAPTISYLLGVPFPDKSRGPVLTEAIDEVSSKGETA